MKYNVILTAAGSSQRYGVNNKLFEPCGSTRVIIEAIKPFLEFEDVTKVIVAIHPSFSDEFLNLLDVLSYSKSFLFFCSITLSSFIILLIKF